MWWPWRQRKTEPAHLRTGEWGEAQAERFLQRAGWKIIGRRVRVGRDELDLVARQGAVLVFVEVKTRGSEAYGRAAGAVDRGKRTALSRAAVRYLGRLSEKPDFFRFDIVEVIGGPEQGEPVIRHLENAFQLDRTYRLPW